MEVLYILVPLAIVVAAIALGAFFWAVKTGQFDDLDTPAARVLFDEDPPKPAEKSTQDKKSKQADV